MMSSQRGLAAKPTTLRLIRITTTALLLIASVTLVSAVLLRPGCDVLIVHNLAIFILGLAAYSWVAFQLAGGIALNLLAASSIIWAASVTRCTLIWIDLAFLFVLVCIASSQQRRRMRQLNRLKQHLDDTEEELYLKEQAIRINRQNQESLSKKLNRYHQLQEIAEILSRQLNLDEICRLAVDKAFDLIGKSDACLLFLLDKEHQELALFSSRKAQDVPVIRTKKGDQFDRYVLRTHRPLMVNDVRRDFRFNISASDERPLSSVIACPLIVSQSAEGLIRLDSRNVGCYAQDDLRFLDIFLGLVNTAVANAKLFAQTQQLALTDGLTGLYRRQPFMDQLDRELARSIRTREPLSVLMLDIDDFKKYNDNFGHTAGDLVLRSVSEIMRSSVPADSMCARYGGEEFSVFLPKMSKEQALQVANRIRQSVEEKVRGAAHGSGKPVTVSIGLASFPDDAQSDLELIRRSDQRLYQAKKQGKNRVCSL